MHQSDNARYTLSESSLNDRQALKMNTKNSHNIEIH